MLLVVLAAVQLASTPALAAPPCPSPNPTLQIEICDDPEFRATDRALTAFGVLPNSQRLDRCDDRQCVRLEYEAAIQGVLWSKTSGAVTFERASPVGQLWVLKTEPEWLMVFLDDVNWTKPPRGHDELLAAEETTGGMAHLVNGRAELDLGRCTLLLKPSGATSWTVSDPPGSPVSCLGGPVIPYGTYKLAKPRR
jgi:hypothetical protein